MYLHTNEYAGKGSTWRLSEKETSKIIRCTNRQYATKLGEFGERFGRRMGINRLT